MLVIASDNYFELDLLQFISAYNGKNTLVAIHDIGDKTKASQFGVIQVDGRKVIEFEEKPVEPKCSLVATNHYLPINTLIPS